MLAIALAASILGFASPSSPPCTHSQLHVSHGAFEGTAGHFHWPVVFENRSARACTLRGFPGVSSVSRRHGRQIGVPAARDHSFRPVRTIRLAAHGGTVSSVFTQVDVGVFDPSRCRPKHARGLRVYAPNQFRAFYVRLPHMVCSTPPFGMSDSTITAVVAGRTGF